ncbi:MAG: hypothetical protein ACJ8KU_01875 [Chthoniobacterales bacterium]
MAEAVPDPQPQSGIAGTVTISPTDGGPVRAGENDSAAMRAAEFVIRAGGKIVTTFVTDEQGRFRIALPPGTYSVGTKGGKPGFGGCGPFEVKVAAGEISQVQWHCNSGLL